MQNLKNCYENVWILSGTSDGPILADKLLKLDYSVFASVVTYRASISYSKNAKLHIITGKLNNKDEIIDFMKRNKIRFVVDATHPFAQIISKNIYKACNEINTPLLLFKRKSLINTSNNFEYINSLKSIKNVNLKGKNILLAIGSRMLKDTANYYLQRGANVFTRVLPTSEGISKAFGSDIKQSNIAILQPSKKKDNLIEKTLCDFWNIDFILCRESGSYSQENWEKIISGSNMKLFLVKKPEINCGNAYCFDRHGSLIRHIISNFHI